ncbi:MAG: OsmC family protein [Thermodesulfovibrionales bacterium]
MSQESVKQALTATIEAIQKNPKCSNAVFRASTELVEDVRCSIKIREFAPMSVDEPAALGGKDVAPNPVELVLAALGTCQEIMYSAYASVMGIQLTKVIVDVKGYLDLKGLFGMDESVPAGFKKICYETSLESPADSETLRKLVQVVESHCPVYDTLARAVEVTGSVSINGKTEGAVCPAA